MLKDSLTVLQELSGYGNPKTRLSRLLKAGTLTQVRRGLFVEGEAPPAQVLAPVIYGPSYLSFQYALAFHGLIPEGVPNLTSAVYPYLAACPEKALADTVYKTRGIEKLGDISHLLIED